MLNRGTWCQVVDCGWKVAKGIQNTCFQLLDYYSCFCFLFACMGTSCMSGVWIIELPLCVVSASVSWDLCEVFLVPCWYLVGLDFEAESRIKMTSYGALLVVAFVFTILMYRMCSRVVVIWIVELFSVYSCWNVYYEELTLYLRGKERKNVEKFNV